MGLYRDQGIREYKGSSLLSVCSVIQQFVPSVSIVLKTFLLWAPTSALAIWTSLPLYFESKEQILFIEFMCVICSRACLGPGHLTTGLCVYEAYLKLCLYEVDMDCGLYLGLAFKS